MRLMLATAALAGLTLAAAAHEPRKGPNGGALVDAGAKHHLELIATGSEDVVAMLYDANDKPVPAAGFKANAILVVGGKTQRFTLQPAEGSKLTGKAPVAIPAGVKGAIQLVGPDGATAQAKF